MYIIKHTLLIFALFATLTNTYAQSTNIDFDKDNFPGKKEELSKAKDELKLGNKYYEEGRAYMRLAIPPYLKAQEFNPNNAILNLKLGQCYLESGTKQKSLQYFEKAYKLNANIDPLIHYYIGYGEQLNNKFTEAIIEYQLQKKNIKKDDENNLVCDKRIIECKNGLDLINKPIRVFIDNLGPVVNGKFPDYGPVISADEDVMYFTSRRQGGMSEDMDENINEYFEDIYVSYQFNQVFGKPVNIGVPVNTANQHDAVVGLSPDGSQLITYNGKNRGDLYYSLLTGTKWSKPESYGKPINSDAHEPSASLSYDGKTIYFISDREGGLGGHDIYQASLNAKGKWDNLKNLGAVINTPYEEDAVFIMPDGKTLYFASQGHNSIGGYDIFKSIMKDGVWGKPENIGMPINTPSDDVFFVLSANGRHGYYASSADGGYGNNDIYKITFLGPEKQPNLNGDDNLIASIAAPINEMRAEKPIEIATPALTLLKGIVTDEDSKQPLDASIELVDNIKNEIVAVFSSNSTTGKYLVSLPSGKNYGIAVKKDGYLFHSENFDVMNNNTYNEIVKNIALKKIDVGKSIVLRNIFFDFDKATIRVESANELERLIKLLQENPTLKIELGSHTDSKGSDDYNMKLSESRSKSVVAYLVTKGIDGGRLTPKGYGETVPIATNDTEFGRQTNRRTEFKILSK
jgi:outer membrane protein OmpA-like peptidoglycan-associated protein/tetratricopeptide (TPR) repeat protein